MFRLISLGLRITASFFIVFLLQFQFDGKSLESYLNDFGKKFIVTKTLQKVSKDGAKFIEDFSKPKKKSKIKKSEADERALEHLRSLAGRITAPSFEDAEKESPSKKTQ